MSKLMKYYDIFNHNDPLSPTFLEYFNKKEQNGRFDL